jgi:putative endonuclease
MKEYFVYIMANEARTVYVGVTNNLERRVYQHKSKVVKGFTSRYGLDKLVYFAETNDVREAIEGEKRIKG